MKQETFAIFAVGICIVIAVLYGNGVFKNVGMQRWEKEVRAVLSDPDSAEFRNITTNRSLHWICGEVNGRNQMGGYVGWDEFLAKPPTDQRDFWDVTIRGSNFPSDYSLFSSCEPM